MRLRSNYVSRDFIDTLAQMGGRDDWIAMLRRPWATRAWGWPFTALYWWLRGRALRAEARRILAARRAAVATTGPYR